MLDCAIILLRYNGELLLGLCVQQCEEEEKKETETTIPRNDDKLLESNKT